MMKFIPAISATTTQRLSGDSAYDYLYVRSIEVIKKQLKDARTKKLVFLFDTGRRNFYMIIANLPY